MSRFTLTKFISLSALSITTAFAGISGHYAETQFSAKCTLVSQIAVNKVQDLSFGEQVAGVESNVTVAPGDPSAAQFKAEGEKNKAVTCAVLDKNIEMKNGNSSILVDNFTYGGDLSADGKASFNAGGKLNDLRVGGTAHIKNQTTPGDYIGKGTFRITYV